MCTHQKFCYRQPYTHTQTLFVFNKDSEYRINLKNPNCSAYITNVLY